VLLEGMEGRGIRGHAAKKCAVMPHRLLSPACHTHTTTHTPSSQPTSPHPTHHVLGVHLHWVITQLVLGHHLRYICSTDALQTAIQVSTHVLAGQAGVPLAV